MTATYARPAPSERLPFTIRIPVGPGAPPPPLLEHDQQIAGVDAFFGFGVDFLDHARQR